MIKDVFKHRRQGKAGNGHGLNGTSNSKPDHRTCHRGDACEHRVLITGGAGFIGTNLAHRLASAGNRVLLYDNLSRPGVTRNLAWLRATHGDLVQLEKADIRDFQGLRKAVRRVSQVFHFAAQVAVTTSLDDPLEDFEINARGTLNLLEALRGLDNPPPLLFTSTNKVYGEMADVRLRRGKSRYEPELESVRDFGFNEQQAIRFHSPYGCSKGAACQYVLDYARTFSLPTAVFRMSCIYGPHQFGTEDQGWVAHFLIKALHGQPITIYGDGFQVRDILFVEDLVNAFLLAQEHMPEISGEAFNIGGGPANTTSLLELMDLIGELHGHQPETTFDQWRAADQQYYVSDTRKFGEVTGWTPKVGVKDGVTLLYKWLKEEQARTVSVVRAPRSAVENEPEAPVTPPRYGQMKPIRVLRPKSVRQKKGIELRNARPASRASQKSSERRLANAA